MTYPCWEIPAFYTASLSLMWTLLSSPYRLPPPFPPLPSPTPSPNTTSPRHHEMIRNLNAGVGQVWVEGVMEIGGVSQNSLFFIPVASSKWCAKISEDLMQLWIKCDLALQEVTSFSCDVLPLLGTPQPNTDQKWGGIVAPGHLATLALTPMLNAGIFFWYVLF